MAGVALSIDSIDGDLLFRVDAAVPKVGWDTSQRVARQWPFVGVVKSGADFTAFRTQGF